jgi:hypothetical protein
VTSADPDLLWQRVVEAYARQTLYRAGDDSEYRAALAAWESAFVYHDIKQLKAEMVAAHPDRGGSSEAFIKARAKYVAAKRKLS